MSEISFDFETKIVLLNSGYEIAIYGIGTYSLTGDTCVENEVISEIAAAHGKSSAQVILRWNLQKGVIVIPGSGNPGHIQENPELFDLIPLPNTCRELPDGSCLCAIYSFRNKLDNT